MENFKELFFQYFVDIIKKKYADFNGRARRKEYWMFALFCFLGGIVLSILSGIIRTPIISSLYSLALFVPGIAISVRRLHDIGRKGISLLFGLIPIAGVIILIVWFVKEGVAGENQFGPDPKA